MLTGRQKVDGLILLMSAEALDWRDVNPTRPSELGSVRSMGVSWCVATQAA